MKSGKEKSLKTVHKQKIPACRMNRSAGKPQSSAAVDSFGMTILELRNSLRRRGKCLMPAPISKLIISVQEMTYLKDLSAVLRFVISKTFLLFRVHVRYYFLSS